MQVKSEMTNIRRLMVTCYLLLALGYPGGSSDGPVQTEAQEVVGLETRLVDTETRSRVLNIIFPTDILEAAYPDAEFALVLRFTPSFSPESQITLLKRRSGSVEVHDFAILGEPLEYQLDRIAKETGSRAPEELAQHVLLRKRRIEVSPRLAERWLRSFQQLRLSPARFVIPSLGSAHSSSAQVDGTTYQLWHATVQESTCFKLVGSELGGPARHDHPLVRWMTSVRRQVLRLK